MTYSANIRFKDGTFEEVPTTVSDRNTIMLGDVALTQSIQLVPDLINFDLVKLVKVTLHYADEANGIDETKDFLFKKRPRSEVGVYLQRQIQASLRMESVLLHGRRSVKNIEPGNTSEKTIVLPETPA
ncbi:hypothetical protein D3H35_27500 [Cohnella faecalis]|uniref:Uncharacterized protein n=1 Tax=Cohnella faecalis TaxID=2315694 RepID=A0A398CID9_9BACL|nr:hypothetical protein D3H35_27500 [Cohnella faecalis]